MTLKELLDTELVHDNVKIVQHNTNPNLDYIFKATQVYSRPVKPEDFKFNKNTKLDVDRQFIQSYLNREVESITGAKQAYMTLIILK